MTRPRPWKRWIASLHLWLSLVVGLQVLAWMVSGLFMVSQPIERVRSEHRVAQAAPLPLQAGPGLVPPEHILQAVAAPVQRLALDHLAGQQVYTVETTNRDKALFSATTGQRLSPLDEAWARRIAEAAIDGTQPVTRATLINADPPLEYRGTLPVWRLDFDDAEQLSVYVEADTGRVAARRSNLWRVFDVMWALHIMDYRERENFNHPLLVAVTALALLMTLAGLVLMVLRLQYRWKNRRHQQSPRRRAGGEDDGAHANHAP
jgi:PepSY-associated TM region